MLKQLWVDKPDDFPDLGKEVLDGLAALVERPNKVHRAAEEPEELALVEGDVHQQAAEVVHPLSVPDVHVVDRIRPENDAQQLEVRLVVELVVVNVGSFHVLVDRF